MGYLIGVVIVVIGLALLVAGATGSGSNLYTTVTGQKTRWL